MKSFKFQIVIAFLTIAAMIGASSLTGLSAAAGPLSERAKDATTSAAKGAKKAKRAKKAKKRRKKRTKRRRKKRVKKRKICRRRNGKRRCRWVPVFQGKSVQKAALRTEPLPTPTGDIWVYAVNFREELKVNIYSSGGQSGEFNDEVLAQLDGVFRCKRTGETRLIDPHLYEILSIIYEHFGQKRIDLVSGYREQKKESSRHFHGSAMDIRVPGVSTRELFDFAATLDLGGMGVGRYPNSDFVHVDFRAPGAKSYRWTDYSYPDNRRKKKKRKKRKRRKRPNS